MENSFELIEILGEGGSGIVYLAQDSEGQKVVVKQFKSSILDITSQSWKREIDTLQQMKHPQLPKYIGFYDKLIEHRRLPHLVMEYVEGSIKKHSLKRNYNSLKSIVLYNNCCCCCLIYPYIPP